MQLSDPIRPRRTIGLTPLIDVVFLLLVFFMLASTFLRFGTVEIETAGAGAPVADPSQIILIHIEGNERFLTNGNNTISEDLVDAINARVATGSRDVVAVLRPQATVADLVEGLRLIRRSRATSVRVVD